MVGSRVYPAAPRLFCSCLPHPFLPVRPETSRSSSFTRCFSEVVTPSRAPESTEWRRTHSYSVCGTQPIFGAIDCAAAHSEGYSPRCSRTMRIARSRTSGENFVDLFIRVSSQRFYPPRYPGRFRLGICISEVKTARKSWTRKHSWQWYALDWQGCEQVCQLHDHLCSCWCCHIWHCLLHFLFATLPKNGN